jgi:hypothetical protein
MSRCTLPSWFGLQKWFDDRFLDLCIAHDEAYVLQMNSKLSADWNLAFGFWKHGAYFLALCAFIYCQLPLAYWMWYRRKWFSNKS